MGIAAMAAICPTTINRVNPTVTRKASTHSPTNVGAK